MPHPIPACFRGGAAAGPPPLTAAGPSLTTSVYDTHLGLAALTWSRTVLGLSLRAVLRLDADDEYEEEPLRFRIRPWLLWKRQGTRRFHLKDHSRHRCVDFAWDLTRASFPHGGGPEPAAGFFVAVSVDGEMLLVAGDLADEAYKKSKAQLPQSPLHPCPALISRREHVVLADHGGRRSYRTRARFGGRDREISIELGAKEKGREAAMTVGIDGERVLQVRRLRWKFRGSEKVEVNGGGGGVQVSWDLHNWFFQPKDEAAGNPGAAAAAAELGRAVFVLRFEGEQQAEEHSGKRMGKEEGHIGNAMYKSLVGGVYNGKNNWSESSSGGGGGGGGGEKRRERRRRSSLRKTGSSSSSTSSASSASASTVMEWASPEEVELQRAQGFSLLVYAWKS